MFFFSMQAWLTAKTEEAKEMQRLAKLNQPDPNIAVEKAQAAQEAYNEWLETKRKQSKANRLLENSRKADEAAQYIIRDRELCDEAFRRWATTSIRWFVNPFTHLSAMSKMTNWVKLKNKQHLSKLLLSNERSHFRVLSIEPKVRKLCAIQGFTLGVNGLMRCVCFCRMPDLLLTILHSGSQLQCSIDRKPRVCIL